MFVDSDDYLLPNVIGKLLFEVSRLELDFLIFDYIIAEKGGHISHSLPSESSIREGSDMFFDPDFPWWEEQVVAWRKIYRTDFLRKNEINFAEGVMYEDNDFAIKAYACAQRVKYCPVSAYVYRVNHQSFTRKRPSSAHIKYHIDLCWRLIALKEWIVSSGKDERFVPLIDSFVRSELRIATETARGLLPEEKQISKGILRSSLSSDLRRYMGRRLICKLSLGLI